VPGVDDTVYLVVDELGELGQVWREADVETADIETVIADVLTEQYIRPLRVVAFNTAQGWSRDVSGDVAREVRRRSDLQRLELSPGVETSSCGSHRSWSGWGLDLRSGGQRQVGLTWQTPRRAPPLLPSSRPRSATPRHLALRIPERSMRGPKQRKPDAPKDLRVGPVEQALSKETSPGRNATFNHFLTFQRRRCWPESSNH
jgi:hypothetical protein